MFPNRTPDRRDLGHRSGFAVLLAGLLLCAQPVLGQAPSEGLAPAARVKVPVAPDPAQANATFGEALRAFDDGRYSRALELWLPLARGGDPAAQRNIGHLYRFGLGQPQDFEAAASWYRMAAEAGLDRAQANLAMMYLRGQGVEQDAQVASYWMAGAAVQGHAISQYNLALLYLRGEGVPRNEAIAVGWLFRAAQAGHAGALEALGRVVPKISGPFGPPPPPPEWPGATARADRPDIATDDGDAIAGPAPVGGETERPPPQAPATAPRHEPGTQLQTADSQPEAQSGLWSRIGKSLVEQTVNLLTTDQDLALERESAGGKGQ